MNTLAPKTRIDILFLETTNPAFTLLVWCADSATAIYPASFLTMRLHNGVYIENSYLEEGGVPASCPQPDPFHKSAHLIASIPAERVGYFRDVVRRSLPCLRDWSIDVLLDPLRREGLLEEGRTGEVGRTVMDILAVNRGIVEGMEEEERETKEKVEERKEEELKQLVIKTRDSL
ncbi:hypothetical protein BJX64DRAFT_290954 [Aspergillus heterothallicus]